MKLVTTASLFAAFAALLTGCQSDKHTMVEPPPGSKVVCSACYDEISKVQRVHPRTGTRSTETISTHKCEWCKSEMTIYSQDGVLMVRCPQCAPEGVPCDKCLPPKDYKPRPPQGIDVPAESNPAGSSLRH